MSGSTPTAAVTADLAYFYRRQLRHPPRFSIVGGGTGTGITDAARGIVDVGLASRALAADDPPGLVFSPIALSGVCLVTNRANPVPGLGRAQIQDLVAGRLTSWTQVPGSARTDPIAPVALDERAGARSVFLSVFVDLETPLAYAPRTLATAAQMRDFVRATPAALGYVDLAFARRTARRALRGHRLHSHHDPLRRVPGPPPARVRHPRPPTRRDRALPALDRPQPNGTARDRHALRAALRVRFRTGGPVGTVEPWMPGAARG